MEEVLGPNIEFNSFIQEFEFKRDESKPGRILFEAKIGDVYMSRLVLEPGVVSGNYYHRKTYQMFYLAKGQVLAAFEDVATGRRKEVKMLEVARRVVHVPVGVALATKNIGEDYAVLVYFSDHPLRAKDDVYYHEVLKYAEK